MKKTGIDGKIPNFNLLERIYKKKPIEICSPSVIGKKEKHKLTKTITSRNSIKLH